MRINKDNTQTESNSAIQNSASTGRECYLVHEVCGEEYNVEEGSTPIVISPLPDVWV